MYGMLFPSNSNKGMTLMRLVIYIANLRMPIMVAVLTLGTLLNSLALVKMYSSKI